MSTLVSKNVQIGADGTASNNFTIYQPESPDGTLRIGNGNTGTTSAQVVLTSAGNVGIGTSSPNSLFHVAGDAQVANFNPSGSGNLRGRLTVGDTSSASTILSFWAASNTDAGAVDRGSFRVGTRNNGGSPRSWGMYGYSESLNTTFSGGLRFTYINTSAVETEGMRIDSSGSLLVGKTVDDNASFGIGMRPGGRINLAVTGTGSTTQVGFYRNGSGTAVGTIATTSTATTYNTSSDYRLKHDIQPMTGAIAKVAQLKPVTYKWNADNSESQGFIAHELQEVVPECVTGEKDAVDADGNPEYQGIDTSFLVATLTAAIQEQQAIIEQLKARVEALEAK